MADRTPDTSDSGQGGHRTPDTGQAPAVSTPPLSAREAASVAGVSERTIRRAIARGELPAGKRAGAYRIAPGDVAAWGGRPDTGPPRHRTPDMGAAAERTAPVTSDRPDIGPAAPMTGAELAPLADVIAHQGAEIARLAAAAALWQERARVLEGRLRALGAGDVATPDDPAAASTPAPVAPWWRRRWGGR